MGGIQECASYGPICIAQIEYKIWPALITKRLTKIMHIVTQNTQFGYKSNLSTIDAIVKIESYLVTQTPHTHLLLMGLSRAFDAVKRTLLWTTIYKKGLPAHMIQHIRTGRRNIRLLAKTQGRYGKGVINNVGGIPRISHKRDPLYYLPR